MFNTARRLRFDLGYSGADMPEARLLLDPVLKELMTPPMLAWREYSFRHSTYANEWKHWTRRGAVCDYMVKHAKRLADRHDMIQYAPRDEVSEWFIVRERAAVRYKKLNDDLSASNIPTEFQKKLLEGMSEDLFGQKGVSHAITIGYQPNSLETDWRGIYAVEWVGNEIVWYAGLGGNLDLFDVSDIPPAPTSDFTKPVSNLRVRTPSTSENDTSDDRAS